MSKQIQTQIVNADCGVAFWQIYFTGESKHHLTMAEYDKIQKMIDSEIDYIMKQRKP